MLYNLLGNAAKFSTEGGDVNLSVNVVPKEAEQTGTSGSDLVLRLSDPSLASTIRCGIIDRWLR